MKKKIYFTLDWDYASELKSSVRGLGEFTKVRVAGHDLIFVTKQTKSKIVIQFNLLEWAREKYINSRKTYK